SEPCPREPLWLTPYVQTVPSARTAAVAKPSSATETTSVQPGTSPPPHASAGAVDRCTPDHTAPDWTRAGCGRPDFPSGQAGAAITARSALVHPAAPSTTIPATSVRSHTPRLIAHPRRLAPGARFRPGRTDLRIRGRRTGRLRRAGAVGGDVTGARRAVRGRPAGGSPGTSRVRCAPKDGSGRGPRRRGVASGGGGRGGARSRT